MTTPNIVRQRHITLMRNSVRTLGNILQHVTQEEAASYRDGGDGWTVLEVICHLRDYDLIFCNRAQMMLEQDYADLPGYDHEALATERDYNSQDLSAVYAGLAESRERFAAFFENLTDEQWTRAGVHPERGHFTMTDAVMQVGLHDSDHLEQITRILAEAEAGKPEGIAR